MHPADRSKSHQTGPDNTFLYYDRSLHRDLAVLRLLSRAWIDERAPPPYS